MKKEELKVKNLSAIEDETLKYIFVSIMRGSDYATTRNALALELGISKRMVSSKYNQALIIVSEKIKEEQEKELQRYIRKCYSRDGLLVLDEIAKYHNMESDELKEIFTDYVDSFTDEEDRIAEQFGFSLEALKKGNIQTLQYRVKGFSEKPKYDDQVFYGNVMKQDIQFLKSVSSICKDYYAKSKSDETKVKVLVKEGR